MRVRARLRLLQFVAIQNRATCSHLQFVAVRRSLFRRTLSPRSQVRFLPGLAKAKSEAFARAKRGEPGFRPKCRGRSGPQARAVACNSCLMGDEILSRERELEVAQEFVRQVALGPAALLVEGEAGIGKTTVWRASCALAEQEGYRILIARPAQPDQRLSFVGLSDLLMEIEPERFAALPKPQRLALDAALLRGQGPAPDQRAVFTAVLSLMVGAGCGKTRRAGSGRSPMARSTLGACSGFVARRTRRNVWASTRLAPGRDRQRQRGGVRT